ncbi:MAG TPA: hypothetical protein VGQ09_07040 [Chitinophagaceae bacterium]|nr:hypothetical protein [Chitinophagaceae bacterium]
MTRWLSILIMIVYSCKSSTTKATKDTKIFSDTTPNKSVLSSDSKPNAGSARILKTHLHDTTVLSGSFILFLRPDSTRFESYDEASGIYDSDSDFGVAIENTEDSILKNKKYKDIKLVVSTNRFIIIKDCKTCPLTIDRDTVDYGIILSSKNKQIKTTYNEVHSGDYLQDVNEYFDLKK